MQTKTGQDQKYKHQTTRSEQEKERFFCILRRQHTREKSQAFTCLPGALHQNPRHSPQSCAAKGARPQPAGDTATASQSSTVRRDRGRLKATRSLQLGSKGSESLHQRAPFNSSQQSLNPHKDTHSPHPTGAEIKPSSQYNWLNKDSETVR